MSNPETSGRQERRRNRTRTALIQAAQDVLAEGGDLRTSIQDIATRADVGFGTFYNHFTDKAELYQAARAAAFEQYQAWRNEHTKDETDPVARMALAIRATGRFALEQPRLVRVLTSRVARPGSGPPERLRIAVQEAARELAPPGADVTGTVVAAMGAIDAILEELPGREPLEQVRLCDGLARDLLRMLGADQVRIAELVEAPWQTG